MNREEQKKLKNLKNILPKILKDKIKNYPFRKKDYMIWYSENELFFCLLITVNVTQDGCCVCNSTETVKPLWLDELLWDFLNMENNKTEPLSLRAVGSFAVNGAEIFTDSQELKDWDIGELDKCVDGYLAHFSNSVQTVTIDDFMKNIKSKQYHSELREALTYVYNREYFKALNCLQGLGEGVFQNGELFINNEIREFCKNELK